MKRLLIVSMIPCLTLAMTIQAKTSAKIIYGSDYTVANYDNKKTCKAITPKTNIPEDSFESNCQGLGGYKINISGMDLRSMLTLKYGKTLVAYNTLPPSGFGEKVEWRYHLVNGKKQYHGLIHRFYTQKYDEKKAEWLPQDQDEQSLVVMKLAKEKSCIVGIIPASKTMNEQARKLSDNLNAPCKPELNNAD